MDQDQAPPQNQDSVTADTAAPAESQATQVEPADGLPPNLNEWRHLADLNVGLNGLSFVLIVMGLVAIKKKREAAHKALMISAALCSTVFLVSYLIYHAQVGQVKFTETGWVRTLYLVILIPHIILAAVQVPLIVGTIWLGLTNRRERHRKWAKLTAPIWLFVSLTGVIVYLLVYTYQGI